MHRRADHILIKLLHNGPHVPAPEVLPLHFNHLPAVIRSFEPCQWLQELARHERNVQEWLVQPPMTFNSNTELEQQHSCVGQTAHCI